MLYTTLLTKIAKFVENNPDDAGSQTVKAIAEAKKTSVEEYLDSLPANALGVIRNIIPGAFPRVLRNCVLVAEINIHDKWRIFPLQPNKHNKGPFKGIIL